jgi:hypothetical protein
VLASIGKIMLIFLPIVVQNSLFFPLKFNFIIGEISLTVKPWWFLSSFNDEL